MNVSFRATGAFVNGGRSFWSTSASGSKGAITSARRAMKRKPTMMPSPIQLIRPASVFLSSTKGWTRRPRSEWRGNASTMRRRERRDIALQPNPRINHGADDVDHEADHHDDRRVHDHHTLYHCHVLRRD